MTKKSNAEAHDPEVIIESAIGNTEMFIMRNGRTLLMLLAAIIIIAGGYFGYKYLYQIPRGKKAAAMMFVAEQQFAADSFSLALNGDGGSDGFLQVIENYGGTAEGNLAKHYAGICYMRMGQYEEALSYLSKYKTVDGITGQIINAQNFGLRGDMSVQLKNYKEAASMYEKAVKASDNVLTTPYYLKKAAAVYAELGENAKALEAYKKIRADYGNSMEARDIDKYIGAIEQK